LIGGEGGGNDGNQQEKSSRTNEVHLWEL
jgi:hypothetical protein